MAWLAAVLSMTLNCRIISRYTRSETGARLGLTLATTGRVKFFVVKRVELLLLLLLLLFILDPVILQN